MQSFCLVFGLWRWNCGTIMQQHEFHDFHERGGEKNKTITWIKKQMRVHIYILSHTWPLLFRRMAPNSNWRLTPHTNTNSHTVSHTLYTHGMSTMRPAKNPVTPVTDPAPQTFEKADVTRVENWMILCPLQVCGLSQAIKDVALITV